MEPITRNSSYSIQYCVDRFLSHLTAKNRSPRTVGVYAQRLKPMVKYFSLLDKGGIGDVALGDMDDWIVHMRNKEQRWDDHPIRNVREGSISQATLAGYVQASKSFFRWCVEREYIHASPARQLERPNVDMGARSKAILQSDLEAMVAFVRSHRMIQETAVLFLLVDTGCRAGELCSLVSANLDLEKLEADIYGKTGKRTVDFTDRTADVLSAWIRARPAAKTDHIFLNDKNGPMNPGQLYTMLRRIGEKVGARRFNPQSIRHRVGQSWFDQGANLETIREKLGHKDVTTTAKYYGNQDRERIKANCKKYSLVKYL